MVGALTNIVTRNKENLREPQPFMVCLITPTVWDEKNIDWYLFLHVTTDANTRRKSISNLLLQSKLKFGPLSVEHQFADPRPVHPASAC
jgi:hypothetical protein